MLSVNCKYVMYLRQVVSVRDVVSDFLPSNFASMISDLVLVFVLVAGGGSVCPIGAAMIGV